jgi:hypothetical protein
VVEERALRPVVEERALRAPRNHRWSTTPSSSVELVETPVVSVVEERALRVVEERALPSVSKPPLAVRGGLRSLAFEGGEVCWCPAAVAGFRVPGFRGLLVDGEWPPETSHLLFRKVG